MLASTRPEASRARRRSPGRTGLVLKAKPGPAGTTPSPLSWPSEIIVAVTSLLTRPRIERVFSAGPSGEHAAQVSGAEKTISGFEIRHIVAPSTIPRATAKQVRPMFKRAPSSAKDWPFASREAVTMRTESRANPRRAKLAVTASHFADE
jgi:hypothetical protein